MKINVISDTHSNFFNNLSRWERTLEEIIQNSKDNIIVNLGDTVGEYNRLIVKNSKYYISVPGNHDVDLLREKVKIKKNNIPFQYWEAFYDKETWKKLEGWGYGSNINEVSKYFCYFLYPEDNLLLISSHLPIKFDKDFLEGLLSISEDKYDYIYNIYGHSHSSKFNIARRKYEDTVLVSIHIPPFYSYASGWGIELNQKKVSIREIYYKKGEIRVEKVKRPKMGEWIR